MRGRVARWAMALALVASTARGNPVDALGFGARHPALGGAGAAVAEDGAANYYNPAGLVRGRDLRLDVGYQAGLVRLKIGGRGAPTEDVHGLAFALAAPARVGPVRFAFGLGLWLPDQQATRVRALPFAQPRFAYYGSRLQRLLLSANLAVQIVPGLTVGGGLTFMSRTQGTVQLRGQVALSDPDASVLTTAVDVDLLAVRYPQGGIRWDVSRRLTLAVTYRHSFQLDIDQAFDVQGAIGNPGLPPVVENARLYARSRTVDLFQPWQLTAGAAARFGPALVLVDLTFARWSEQPSFGPEVDLALDVGSYNDRVHLPPKRAYPAAGFHDTLIPRVGVEGTAVDGRRLGVLLRGGYAYEPSPVPDQIGESNVVDADRHTFSFGAGLELRALAPVLPLPLALDAHVGVTWLPERVTRKLDPRDPVGDYAAGGAVVQLGLMLRSRL